MESGTVLGKDEGLFGKRREDGNRGTADWYEQLGLAGYETMEAFVEYVPL